MGTITVYFAFIQQAIESFVKEAASADNAIETPLRVHLIDNLLYQFVGEG